MNGLNFRSLMDLQGDDRLLWRGPLIAMKCPHGAGACERFTGRNFMTRAIRHLNKPASESQLAIALGVAAVAMGLLLWGIIWQSSIIVYQRGVIRSLFGSHFGG